MALGDDPQAMADKWVDPYTAKRPSHWLRNIFLLLVLYVMSIGPAMKFLNEQGRPPAMLKTIYKPLFSVMETSSAVDKAINWYIHDLWKVSFPQIRTSKPAK